MIDLTFSVPMEPKAKGAPRSFNGRTVKDPATRRWEVMFADAAREHMPEEPFEGPLVVDLLFILKRPQYMTKRDRKGVLKFPAGLIWAPKKPDRDNLAKAAQDALKRWWRDDAIIVLGQTAKCIAELHGLPRVYARIYSPPDPLTVPMVARFIG